MKILVTGAKGFVGKNLVLSLKNDNYFVYEFDIDNNENDLVSYLKDADFIFHLAGVNRPLSEEEFYDGNYNFTIKLLELIKKSHRIIPLLFSSSIQAKLDNAYGKSKKMAEDEIFKFSLEYNNPTYVFRLYNVFGKWCKPNYNSVVATWCFNIAHNLPIKCNNKETRIDFCYIDDVINSFKACLLDLKGANKILYPEIYYNKSLGEIKKLILSFKSSRSNLFIPLQDGFTKKLYATYLTYLPSTSFKYKLESHADNRGSFTEIFKTMDFGQVSINIIHPQVEKGNHYHMSKNEKFLVLKGCCLTRFRKVDEQEIIKIKTSHDKLEIIDIPPGFTHSIKNIGEEDAIVLMWANEIFNENKPDTFYLKVENE